MSASNLENRLSFMDIFTKLNCSIEIPIIQRDYAQGRKAVETIRDNFLTSLYQYLEDNRPFRDLDFVYGSIRESDNTKYFVPLDGQQRLTTLFLLHWYLALIAGKIADFRVIMVQEDRPRFSYETRTSAREFCKALLQARVDTSALLNDEPGTEKLSSMLVDAGWYMRSWKFDPTIQSMLTMLDAIHVKFRKRSDFYERIMRTDRPVITFMFLDLKQNIGLSDDLYVKMNARGKPLTDFENFKALLEKHISIKEAYQALTRTFHGSSICLADYFKHQIDTTWTDPFWAYKNHATKDDVVDDEMLNTIRGLFSYTWMLERTVRENSKDMVVEQLLGTDVAKKESGTHGHLAFKFYQDEGVISPFSADFVSDALDTIVLWFRKSAHQSTNTPAWAHLVYTGNRWFKFGDLFEKLLSHKLTWEDQILFFAILRYSMCHPEHNAGVDHWMRFVRNVVNGTHIFNANLATRGIQSIENLVTSTNDILQFLCSDKPIEFFDQRTIKEERVKAWLYGMDGWPELLTRAETLEHFDGQIGFLLEWSGVFEAHEAKNELSLAECRGRFSSYLEKMEAVLPWITKPTKFTHNFLWERSVLSKGDYSINASADRKNLLSTNSKLRDYSWKRVLKLPAINSNDGDVTVWKSKRDVIRAVFDDPGFNYLSVESSLTLMTENIPDDWRGPFVSEPRLIQFCGTGFISRIGSASPLLLRQEQHNGRHGDVKSYMAFLRYFIQDQKGDPSFHPFMKPFYFEPTSGDYYASCGIGSWNLESSTITFTMAYPKEGKWRLVIVEKNQNSLHGLIEQCLGLHGFFKESAKWILMVNTSEPPITLVKSICKDLAALDL